MLWVNTTLVRISHSSFSLMFWFVIILQGCSLQWFCGCDGSLLGLQGSEDIIYYWGALLHLPIVLAFMCVRRCTGMKRLPQLVICGLGIARLSILRTARLPTRAAVTRLCGWEFQATALCLVEETRLGGCVDTMRILKITGCHVF